MDMEVVSQKLIGIFYLVNDWLKFAEAKNAVLFAFSGAGVTATLTYINSSGIMPDYLLLALIISTAILCACALISSLSFLPRTSLENIILIRGNLLRNSRSSQKDSDNFYYFGHLRKYKNSELLDALNRLYFENKLETPYRKEHLDLANQIVINSEITYTKLNLFALALWALIASVLVISIFFFVKLIITRIT